MNPQVKSILTSLAVSLAGAIVGWAVKQGFVTADQAASLTADLGSVLVAAIGAAGIAAITWYKQAQHTQPALIQAVNAANNGVSVVPTADANAAGIPAVNEPIKEPGK